MLAALKSTRTLETAELQDTIEKLLGEIDPEVYLVHMKPLSGGPYYDLQIDTDAGIGIDQISRIHRQLRELTELDDNLPNGMDFDISSPGVGEPLVLKRQYKKNVGRTVKLKTTDGQDIKGTLVDVRDEDFDIEHKQRVEGKKKKETVTTSFSYDQVQKIKVLVTF